ncbi:MAG: hypothetical protein QXK74_07425 [Candidatus Nitrosocaldaceae archaeon]
MGNYITVDDVLDFMYIVFEGSDPLPQINKFRDWIDARIDEAEMMLMDKCRTAWHPVERTDRLRRSNALQFRDGRTRIAFYLPYHPVQLILTVSVESEGGLQTLTPSSYTWDEHGIYLNIRGFPAWSSFSTLIVDYVYGYDEVPADVKGALLRMVALELYRLGAITPFLQRQGTEKTIEEMEKYIKEVIARYSNPQVLPI